LARHRNARTRLLHLAAAGLVVCAGCGGKKTESSEKESAGRQARVVSQDDYGAEWPFGPNRGVLRCRGAGSHRIVTFATGGAQYALNEEARRRGFESVEAILVTDHAGLPYDYSPIRDDALALCR
jgi:hypothetical protein